jgi:hypothetical protein
VHPLVFTPRWERIDATLLELARRRQHAGTLAEAESRPGLGGFALHDLHRPNETLPPHFGPISRLFWQFAYDLFVGTKALVAHPRGFGPKAVLVVNVSGREIDGGGTAYLAVRADPDGEPVLVQIPHIEPLLLGETDGTFGACAASYRALVGETVARVNLVAAAALTLARR